MVDEQNKERRTFGQCISCSKRLKHPGQVCTSCKKAQQQKQREAKAERRVALLSRKCKVCLQQMNSLDHRQVVCGMQCRDKNRRIEKIQIKCYVCEKMLFRYPRELKIRKTFCCSLECQRQHSLNNNRGKPKKNALNIKLPIVWVCDCGEVNCGRTCANKRCVYRYCKEQIAKLLTKRRQSLAVGTWEYAISYRLASSRGRKCVRKATLALGDNASGAIAKIIARRKYYESCEWEKRIGNKLSNMRKRRRRKHEKANCNSTGSQAKIGGAAIQMCFNWLDLDSRKLCS